MTQGADDTEFGPWLAQGAQLAAEVDRLQWALADWAAAGAVPFRKQLDVIPASHPIDAKQIRKAARIAQAFPPAERAPQLEYGVHAALLSVHGDDRAELLGQAKAECWSTRQARVAAARRRQETAAFEDDDPERLATHIYRSWNNAPVEIRKHAWLLLQAGADRGFTIIDEEEPLA